MNVVLFGATGMVGGGVLIECLEDPRVDSVVSVGRRPCGVTHPKLREVIRSEVSELGDVDDLADCDACFFCLGVSSAGMSEVAYRRVTLDLTMDVATRLEELNPNLTFCFVSGQGTDSSGQSRFMWARVKGEAENRLLQMGFSAYMFRPGFIQPLKGVHSKTRLYQIPYTLAGPLIPVLKRVFPRHVTTTVNVGRAMIRVAAEGYPKSVLETEDINSMAALETLHIRRRMG